MSGAKWIVFDVESVGLYGESFAIGWVVLDEGGATIEEGWESMGLNPSDWRLPGLQPAKPDPIDLEDFEWCAANIPDEVRRPEKSPFMLCDGFQIMRRRHPDAVLVADCPYPVEMRFLERYSDQAYPLLDVATALTVRGRDPVGTYDRLPSELPKHHPLMDARQSARLWMEALRGTA